MSTEHVYLENEDWRIIEGYNSAYSISNYGRVMRLTPGPKTYAGKILTPGLNKKTGYVFVKLVKNGKAQKIPIHILVSRAFMNPPPNDNWVVDHKNGNKQDPRLVNLEWVSRSENTKRAIRLGLQPLCYGEDNGRCKVSKEQIEEIRKEYETGELTQKQLAEKHKISTTYVNYILNKRNRAKK